MKPSLYYAINEDRSNIHTLYMYDKLNNNIEFVLKSKHLMLKRWILAEYHIT